jgi:hypothetical protein
LAQLLFTFYQQPAASYRGEAAFRCILNPTVKRFFAIQSDKLPDANFNRVACGQCARISNHDTQWTASRSIENGR